MTRIDPHVACVLNFLSMFSRSEYQMAIRFSRWNLDDFDSILTDRQQHVLYSIRKKIGLIYPEIKNKKIPIINCCGSGNDIDKFLFQNNGRKNDKYASRSKHKMIG